jgi:hypothetical protein
MVPDIVYRHYYGKAIVLPVRINRLVLKSKDIFENHNIMCDTFTHEGLNLVLLSLS